MQPAVTDDVVVLAKARIQAPPHVVSALDPRFRGDDNIARSLLDSHNFESI